VSDVSAPACTNGLWPRLLPVSVAQKNEPSTMLSSNVQSIDLIMDGSGQLDDRTAAHHLPRDLVWPSSGLKNWLKRRRIWNNALFNIEDQVIHLYKEL